MEETILDWLGWAILLLNGVATWLLLWLILERGRQGPGEGGRCS